MTYALGYGKLATLPGAIQGKSMQVQKLAERSKSWRIWPEKWQK